MKHRDEQELHQALEVILKASEAAVQNLENDVLQEEAERVRHMELD